MNNMATKKAGLSVISGLTSLQNFGKSIEDGVKSIGTTDVETVVTSEKEAPEISNNVKQTSEISEKSAPQPVLNNFNKLNKEKVSYEIVRVSSEKHKILKFASLVQGTTVTEYFDRILEDYIFRNDLRKYSTLNATN